MTIERNTQEKEKTGGLNRATRRLLEKKLNERHKRRQAFMLSCVTCGGHTIGKERCTCKVHKRAKSEVA